MPNPEKAEEFEKQQLNRVFFKAMVGAFLHKSTAWLGAGTLTWATVVVMGGFASQVPLADFVQVTYLVVEIPFLLALAFFTRKLVTKKSLFRGSLDPVSLCYQDKRLGVISVIQGISVLVQFAAFILPCTAMAISSLQRDDFKAIDIKALLFSPSRLRYAQGSDAVADLQACLRSCASVSVSNSTIRSVASCVQSCFPEPTAIISNLDVCLYTFFWLVLATCILAFLCVVYITAECFVWHESDLSLKKYHDEVMSRALKVGLVEADEFDAKEFVLQGLGEDLAIRNIAPLEVKRQNSEVLNYLFDHPKGVEMVYEGLASGDTIRQQTSANILGFWAPRHDLEKNTILLCKLAEKLGLPGKTAEAAANSFSALALEWQNRVESPLLRINVASDGGGSCNVVVKVVDLVLRKRLSTLQVYVRLLDSFFTSLSVCRWLASQEPQDMEAMISKLLSIVNQEAGARSRARRTNATNTRIDVSIRARTGFLAFSALDRLMDFGSAVSTIEAVNSSQETPIQSDTAELDSSQGATANPEGNGVISDAPPTSGTKEEGCTILMNRASNNCLGTTDSHTTKGTSNDTVNGDASSNSSNNIDGWHAQARRLLRQLDEKLKDQKFMWWTEAERYRELCCKYLREESVDLGTWLEPAGPCKITGKKYENLI